MDILNLFKGKSVFITGHTGFKGAWLAFWLSELGANVTGYALEAEYENSLFDALGLSNKVNHIIGDIRDLNAVQTAMNKAEPDFVFHLAAQALLRRSYDDPLLTFSTNVMGAASVLEAVRNCPSVRSLVYITSDKCYFNKEWPWGYREDDELGGPDPYSGSKACAELVFQSYYLSYFQHRAAFGCGSTRAGNVIGGGDRSIDRIVPDIIRAAENGEAITLRSPDATRPWQHVMDPLYGYMVLAAQLYNNPQAINGEGWNFGPSSDSIRTVLDITKGLTMLWDNIEIKINRPKDAPHEANLLHLSIDKARSRLGWNPRYDFDLAVQETGAWYKHAMDGDDIVNLTRAQIDRFMSHA
ncbi:MAG: CDP-glucose 4,6-dehydratase [Alphaproteobacteria bacterium]|nr:MAG: CDP-glucose 4,6-dehydratase [Alphaproteobacteria bacterium]